MSANLVFGIIVLCIMWKVRQWDREERRETDARSR